MLKKKKKSFLTQSIMHLGMHPNVLGHFIWEIIQHCLLKYTQFAKGSFLQVCQFDEDKKKLETKNTSLL